MVQYGNVESIQCPACGLEHDSQLTVFPKTMMYREQQLHLPDYYHTCPDRKEFVQTGRDIIENWKAERNLKKQVDQQLDAPPPPYGPSPGMGEIPVGAIMNINGENMAWTGSEWVRI